MSDFWLSVGDRVEHVGDPGEYGVVLSIDDNLIESHGVTTCRVLWDGCKSADIQWTNKLAMVSPAFKSRAWVDAAWSRSECCNRKPTYRDETRQS